MQCVKLRVIAIAIAPLRSVTLRFVLRKLSISLQCYDYAINWLGNFSVLTFSSLSVWSGAARSRPSAVTGFPQLLFDFWL